MAKRPKAEELAAELVDGVRRISQDVVEHFLTHMPDAYFSDTDPSVQASHVGAILGARVSGQPVTLTLSSPDKKTWTFIDEGSHPGQLASFVARLPTDRVLRSAKIHTAADGSFVLDVFEFGEEDETHPQPEKAINRLLTQAPSEVDEAGYRAHLARCARSYLESVSGERAYSHFSDLSALSTTARCTEAPYGLTRITVTTASRNPGGLFQRIVTYAGHIDLNIRRAYLDRFGERDGGTACAITLIVDDAEKATSIERDLERLEWLDEAVLELFYEVGEFSLQEAELLVALAHLIHPALARLDSHGFARSRLYRLAVRNAELCKRILRLFCQRFGERLNDRGFERERRQIAAAIRDAIDDKYQLGLFSLLLEAVSTVLRTNFFVPHRLALSFRFDPALLESDERSEVPYGAFFVHGRSFDAFHVRFRDIARGGVRVVLPRSLEQYGAEADGIYDEAYDLAFAQQLKNKDIPEGGSKAVVLVRPGTSGDTSFRAFADSLLDLLCEPALVDRWGAPEVVYLGPDENVSPELIDWLVERARHRNYPMASAFISSKPDTGVNHKEYGVTSEGVTVFLEEALNFVGIDPRAQPFTVKLTGGPDGDVAGNEIKILQREYGDNARIVLVSDGSGFASDPNGLNGGELVRLVSSSLPIARFDRSKLSPEGELVPLDAPDGVRRRNLAHNHVVADAFVPAGGRPETIHRYNWQSFLVDGEPSARVIVEGANLFITPDARSELSRAGVLVVKDSSANKTGVICSSYEIIASMLLSPEEFLRIKERFVQEVLARLRDLARREARLLFREKAANPGVDLPTLSVQISHRVIAIADSLENVLGTLAEADRSLVSGLVDEHIPATLLEVARDRLSDRIPASYCNSIISSSLASRIVYQEGLSYLPEDDPERLAEVALNYLRMEREMSALIESVRGSGLEASNRIIELLRAGGPRDALSR